MQSVGDSSSSSDSDRKQKSSSKFKKLKRNLDGTHNWEQWDYVIQGKLLLKDLWKYVDPADSNSTPKLLGETGYEKWEKGNKKAYWEMVWNVDDSLFHITSATRNAAEAYKNLHEHLDSSTMDNKTYVLEAYFTLKMQEGGSIEDFVREAKVLRIRAMRFTKELGNDVVFGTVLLKGLLPSTPIQRKGRRVRGWSRIPEASTAPMVDYHELSEA